MVTAYELPSGAQYNDTCPRCGWPSDPGDTCYESSLTGWSGYCSRGHAEADEARYRERMAARRDAKNRHGESLPA